jgi:hypothetical protein
MLNPKSIKNTEKQNEEIKIWYNIRGNKLIKTTYDPTKNIYITEEINWN